MKCANGEQEIIIDDDGVLEMPGYDPQYEEAMVEFSNGKYEKSVCYYLYRSWEEIPKEFHDEIVQEMGKPRYEYVRDRGRMWGEREVVRKFNDEDLACILAEALQYYVKEEDESGAVALAKVIGGMNLNLNEQPDIEISGHEVGEWYQGVLRYETHALNVCDVKIAEWQRMSERRIYGILCFDTDVQDLKDDVEDSYPSDLIVAVLDALGMKDSDPSPPEEFSTPKPDETKKGAYGVMYEELIYDRDKELEDRDVQSVEVVIYDNERTAKEAAELSESLMHETGDHTYRITVVRRMSPSEREEQKLLAAERKALRKQYRLFKRGVEKVPEPDKLYTQWTELEEDEDDRPGDFED